MPSIDPDLRARRGALVTVSVVYRNNAGAPADATGPTVVVTPPGGPAQAAVAPARITTGVYRFTVSIPVDAVLGAWTATWAAVDVAGQGAPANVVQTVDVVDTLEADAVLRYGATVAAVKELVPHRTFEPGRRPNDSDVAGYIDLVTGLVDARIGAVVSGALDAGLETRLSAAARAVVVIGAAAFTDAAGAPERANPNDASTYAQWLWARYEEAWEDLRAILEEVGSSPGEEPGDLDDVGDPAWHFPEPVGWAERGI